MVATRMSPLHGAPEEVVQDTQPQRAADRVDAVDIELGERRGHDGKARGQHRSALRLERIELQPGDVAGPHHSLAQPGQAFARDAGG